MEKDIKDVVKYYQLQAMRKWMENYMKAAFKWVLIYFALSYLLYFFRYVCYIYIAICLFFIISCLIISGIIFYFELCNYNIPDCKFSKKLSVEQLYELIIKEDKEIHDRVHDLIVEDYYELEDIRYKAILIRHFSDLYDALKYEYVIKKSYAETYKEIKDYLDDLKIFVKKLHSLKSEIIKFFSGDSELVELAEDCFNHLIDNYKDSGLSSE